MYLFTNLHIYLKNLISYILFYSHSCLQKYLHINCILTYILDYLPTYLPTYIPTYLIIYFLTYLFST